MTPPLEFDASGGPVGSLAPQLLHLAAEVLRFILPAGFLGAALVGYRQRLKAVIARR